MRVKNEATYFFKLRIISLSLIMLIFSAAIFAVIYYPENLGPKGIVSFSWTIGLLIVYSIFCFFLPAIAKGNSALTALKEGTLFGCITGVIWMIHVTVEHFINLPGNVGGITTLVFMFLNFSLYGAVAFRAMKKTGKAVASLLSSIWSAMFGILVLIVFVIALIFLFTKKFENNLYSGYTKAK